VLRYCPTNIGGQNVPAGNRPQPATCNSGVKFRTLLRGNTSFKNLSLDRLSPQSGGKRLVGGHAMHASTVPLITGVKSFKLLREIPHLRAFHWVACRHTPAGNASLETMHDIDQPRGPIRWRENPPWLIKAKASNESFLLNRLLHGDVHIQRTAHWRR
jgi:hypothetical protein